MSPVTAAELYRILNHQNYRRSQPYKGDAEAARAIIQQAIQNEQPIPLVMRWAMRPDAEIEEPEKAAMRYLAAHLAKISKVYPAGINLQLVFVDTHLAFNGQTIPANQTQKLQAAFKEIFDEHKGLRVRVTCASDYLPFTKLPDGSFREFEQLAERAKKSSISPGLKRSLAQRAADYYNRPGSSPEEAATMYYELCKWENGPLGRALNGNIFLTYNPPSMGEKKHFGIPDGLPAICLYSVARGITDKPWNMDLKIYDQIMAQRQKRRKPEIVVPQSFIQPERENMRDKKFAVIGGGLAGLMTSYQLLNQNPDSDVTVFERGSEESYRRGQDNSKRASLGGSAARTIRLSGAAAGVGEWNVRQTLEVIKALQTELDQHPERYPDIAGRVLFHPEASVIIALNKDNEKAGKEPYKTINGLAALGVAYTEVTGADLKKRFPGVYETVPDAAVAVIEEPYDPVKNPNGVAGVMDTEAVMAMLRAKITEKGGQIRYNQTIENVESLSDQVVVKNSAGEEAAFDHAVLAPGAWLEKIKNGKGESLTKQFMIEPRLERIVVMDIDLESLGINTKGIPFTKGLAPKGAEGALYSYNANSKDGHVKFFPVSATRSVDSLEALHAPLSDEEKQAALQSASLRFNIPLERLEQHVTWSQCAYTSPKVGEKMLVAPLGERVTFVGLDSSGSARVSGGLGAIAAHLAMGLEEPVKGAFDTFGLAAHYKTTNQGIIVKPEATQVVDIIPSPHEKKQRSI